VSRSTGVNAGNIADIPPAAVSDAAAEAVFAEPWEARAFALAVTLSQSGKFSWDEFRDRLIAEIAEADAALRPAASGARADSPAAIAENSSLLAARADLAIAAGPRGPYYRCWLVALEKLLREKSLLNLDEIERRAAAIAASPPAPTKAQSRGPIKIA
jgi:Nitrile hydratase beta subunit, N-terminal